MTRHEYMNWCKKRALEYLDNGEIQNAIASMLSDLSKHDETKDVGGLMAMTGMKTLMDKDPDEARQFITGFN